MATTALLHRVERPQRGVTLPLVVWAGGAALCAVVLVGALRVVWLPDDRVWVTYGAALASITLGVVVWLLRPESRTGILLTAFAFTGVVADLDLAYPRSELAVTLGYAATMLAAPFLVHAVLSYPTGRLTSPLDRGFVAAAYGFGVLYALPFLLFYDPRATSDPDVWNCPPCAQPLTHVGWYDTGGIRDGLDSVLFAFTVGFLALLVRKLLGATPGGRRVVLPLVVAAVFAAAQFGVQIALFGEPVNSWTRSGWYWVVIATGLVVPLALVAGLLWGRAARSAVADLVVELEHTPSGSVRDTLAKTLGDPSLELALWLPDRRSYVDGGGRPLELPEPGSDRAVTLLGSPEAPVAALVHDPALLERRAFLTAAGAAARFALENERLQAELRLQLEEVRASRARIVEAGDEERRRLERNLHDGAQQHLLGLGVALQLARAELGAAADGAAELLAEAEGQLRAALRELRELAHGIHPAILTDQGLAAALRSLADRSPVPVTIVGASDQRLGDAVEAAAYFLVSESLANVTKYARASAVRVSVTQRNGDAIIDIEDDGVGGADPARGSGLRGLFDRVQALGGVLRLESPPGGGTRLHAEIPCK